MKQTMRIFSGTLVICLCLVGLAAGMLMAEAHTQQIMAGDGGSLIQQGTSLAAGALDAADTPPPAWTTVLPPSWRMVWALPTWGIQAAEQLFTTLLRVPEPPPEAPPERHAGGELGL